MASLDNQQPWIPYEATKDCSQGFCSIYCPQWCYIIFPPPPPFALSDDDPSSGAAAFSPLVISIIAIIAAALLLVSYYTIISKYCGNLGSSIRHLSTPPAPGGEGRSRRHDVGAWHVSPSNGLDEALINKITVYRYRRGEGLISGADCSVCLAEFREDESLRLLPKCSHAFHLRCIDTWLKSHSNCPLCRADILLTESPVRLQLPEREFGRSDEVAVVIEDVETNLENECDASKDPTVSPCDSFGIRRSFSMDSFNHGRVSISDVLRMSMEDEFLVAKDHGLVPESGSSRRQEGRSPVPMKRSVSGGRICFTRN